MSTDSDTTALFLKIKEEIASSHPDFQERVTRAWGEVLVEMAKVTDDIAKTGPNVRQFLVLSYSRVLTILQYIPQVNFADLDTLSPEVVDEIKRKGSVVIKDVVDDKEAIAWKQLLEDFVKANPNVEGMHSIQPEYHCTSNSRILFLQAFLRKTSNSSSYSTLRPLSTQKSH